jgi:arginase family enzyme
MRKRNFEFARKNIHRAERQHAEPRARKTVRRVAEAVERFVHRAVAAGGDNQIESFPTASAASRRASPGAVVAFNAHCEPMASS